MWTSTKRIAAISALGLAAALGSTAAHAGGVQWNIGVNLPVAPGVVVAVDAYRPAPRVYYAPPVAYYPPPQVVYAPPPPVYVVPRPRVVYGPPAREWCPPRHGHRVGHGHGRGHERYDDDGRRGWRGDDRQAYGYGYR